MEKEAAAAATAAAAAAAAAAAEVAAAAAAAAVAAAPAAAPPPPQLPSPSAAPPPAPPSLAPQAQEIVALHKRALLRFYAQQRPDFATEDKVTEIWGKVGSGVWPMLCEKYSVDLVAGVLAEVGAPLPEEGHPMAPKFTAIRAAVGVLAHKAALQRLYVKYRPDFANAAKIDELWGKMGAGLWPLLAQKYTLGDVAPFTVGLSLPSEDAAFAALREAQAVAVAAAAGNDL